MVGYYVIHIRKDIVKIIPIILVLLVVAYFGGKSLLQWQPMNETLPPFENGSSPRTTPPANHIPPSSTPPPADNCANFQSQLDTFAQQAFKEGYLCAKQQKNCPVPESITIEEREQLQKNVRGFYFDAKNYVNQKSTTKDYYIGLMSGTYSCTPTNMDLLKKFIYEQQWKSGILYE